LKKNILSKKLRKLLKYFGIYLGVKLHEGWITFGKKKVMYNQYDIYIWYFNIKIDIFLKYEKWLK
jgi:hypothetical protein